MTSWSLSTVNKSIDYLASLNSCSDLHLVTVVTSILSLGDVVFKQNLLGEYYQCYNFIGKFQSWDNQMKLIFMGEHYHNCKLVVSLGKYFHRRNFPDVLGQRYRPNS